jgi:hypothetical protein
MYSITAKNTSLSKQRAESRRTQTTFHTQYQYTLALHARRHVCDGNTAVRNHFFVSDLKCLKADRVPQLPEESGVLLCVARANKSTELNNFTIAFPEG